MSYDDAIQMIQNAVAHRSELYAQVLNKHEDAANEQAIDILRAAKKVMHADWYLRSVSK